MATQYSIRRRVKAPLAVVWATLTDVERMPEWTPSMTDVRFVEGSEVREGAQVSVKQPRMVRATWIVTKVVTGRSFVWSTTAGGIITTGEHVLRPGSGAQETEVLLRIAHEGRGAGLVGALTMRRTRRYVQQELDGLARRAEALARARD